MHYYLFILVITYFILFFRYFYKKSLFLQIVFFLLFLQYQCLSVRVIFWHPRTGPQLMAYLCQVNMWLERYRPNIDIWKVLKSRTAISEWSEKGMKFYMNDKTFKSYLNYSNFLSSSIFCHYISQSFLIYSASSILEIAKHFFPKSLSDAPQWYSSLLSITMNLMYSFSFS